MKKKIFIVIPLAIILLLLFVTPVFAGDPLDTDTQVTVEVVTLGNVDLDVGVNAGGDVSVVVDGYDIDAMAAQVDAAQSYLTTLRQSPGMNVVTDVNFGVLWDKKMAAYAGFLNDMDYAIGMLAEAQAKLIQGYTLNRDELTNLGVAIVSISDTMKALDATTSGTFNELRQRDDEIWNQLMYGAEAHILLLQEAIAKQANLIEQQKRQLDSLNGQLVYLTDYQNTQNDWSFNEIIKVDKTINQILYIGGGCILVSLSLIIYLLISRRRYIKI